MDIDTLNDADLINYVVDLATGHYNLDLGETEAAELLVEAKCALHKRMALGRRIRTMARGTKH